MTAKDKILRDAGVLNLATKIAVIASGSSVASVLGLIVRNPHNF